jgi:hypothetical protein
MRRLLRRLVLHYYAPWLCRRAEGWFRRLEELYGDPSPEMRRSIQDIRNLRAQLDQLGVPR